MTGFEQLADGLDVMNALASQRGAIDVDRDAVSTHIIERGLIWVVPLARVTGDDEGDRERFHRVCGDLEMDGIHYFGGDYFHGETSIEPDEGYGMQLEKVGIHLDGSSCAWRIHDFAAVYVRASDGDQATLSLHILPAEWIWPRLGDAKRDQSRRRTKARELAAADPRWEWPVRA